MAGRDEMDTTIMDLQPVFGQPLQGLGIDAVFKPEDAPADLVLLFTGMDGDCGLNDYGAVIQVLIDKVYRGPAQTHSILRSLFLGMQPWKTGKQGWMDIQDPVGKGLNKFRTDQAHIPGQAHGPDTGILQDVYYRPIMGLPGGVLGLRHNPGRNPVLGSPLQAFDSGHIGDNELNAGIQDPLFNTIDEGLQVGSPAGNEDCYGKGHRKVFSVQICLRQI
jgi:hypothetical protein